MKDLPETPSCVKNQKVILDVISTYLEKASSLLEIGSGTGEHAIYMSKKFPHLLWQTSDLKENHVNISTRIERALSSNILAPLEFEIGKNPFPNSEYDIVFTANTLHIMPWKKVKTLLKLLGENLKKDNIFIVYGPFKYNSAFTSNSNEEFDALLKQLNPQSGIRNFEDITVNLSKNGFSLLADVEMPACNRTLVFQKEA